LDRQQEIISEEQVVCIQEMRNLYKIIAGKPERKALYHSDGPGKDGKIILK
jgi:hypothetical protein